KGVLPAFEKALGQRSGDLLFRACLDVIQQRLRPDLEGAWKRGSAVFEHVEQFARSDPSGMMRLAEGFAEHPIWTNGLEEDLAATLVHLGALLAGFEQLRERVKVDEEAATFLEEPLLELR